MTTINNWMAIFHSCQADGLGRGNGPDAIQAAGILGSYGKTTPKAAPSTTAPATTESTTTTTSLATTAEAPKKIQLSEGWNPTLYK